MTVLNSDPRTHGPLAGIKVVEFSQNAAVPQCAKLLAGMGADVVKVEPPTGDAMRHLAALGNGDSRTYATINPGKRSMCLDLTKDTSRPAAQALIRWADIVLIGLKRGDLERYSLDWDSIHSLNPKAVSLEFTAFGPEGSEADLPGYDPLAQAESGLGWMMNRSIDGVPLATRPAFVDFAAGNTAAVAVLGALRLAERTGIGQRVDASLLGSALTLGTPALSRFATDDEKLATLEENMSIMRQAGMSFDDQRALYESSKLAYGSLYDVYVRPYRTSDGVVSIAAYSQGLMDRFHQITGVPGFDRTVEADPAAATAKAAAEELFATRTTDEWIEELRAAGFPCARYNTPYEAVENPQAVANDYVVDFDHPNFGKHRVVAMPFSLSDAPVGLSGPAPMLDQHTAQVLAELGIESDF